MEKAKKKLVMNVEKYLMHLFMVSVHVYSKAIIQTRSQNPSGYAKSVGIKIMPDRPYVVEKIAIIKPHST